MRRGSERGVTADTESHMHAHLSRLLLTSALLLGVLAASAQAGPITTGCTLTAQNSPTTVGEQANFRFFARAASPEDSLPSPSGLVTFWDGPPLVSPIVGTAILLPALKDNSDVTFSTSSLSVGDHTIYATLLPTTASACPLPPSANHRVNPPPASPSSTGVAPSPNPSKFGQSVTFTASVARQGGGAVSGTVQFKADGNDLGSAQTVDGGGQASVSTSTLAVGSHTITADFTSGNPNTLNSSGSTGQTVEAASTATSVSSSRNPSQLGQAVTFTAQASVTAPGAGTPVGTVQFRDNGTDLGSPQTLDGSGKAGLTTSTLTVGAHTISATYTPSNGNFTASSGSVSQTVERAKTSLAYDGATAGDYHDPATLSATLTRQDDASPVAGKPVHFTMGSSSCDATTNAAGKASCVITPQEPAGAYTVKASFAGDADYEASDASKPFQVTREQTSLTYTGDTLLANGGTARMSGVLREDDGAPATAGRSVTFTLGSGATAQSCTALTNASGTAACDITPVAQPLGPGTVKAVFAQDAFYLASSASAQTIVYAFPTRGAFAIGDRNAATGGSVTFFGAQWEKANPLGGGAAPSAFKGFVTAPGTPPRCGGTFTADPGNSGSPPATVPSYMGTLVTNKLAKSGPDIGGTATQIVIVKTSSYGPSPGQGGTGTIVAVVCRA